MDAPSRTPQGGLRVPASLTRSGVFLYHRADGSEVREYRPEDEVFKADSLASLPGAPVTALHPAVPVRADNYREHAKGHVGDSVVRNGERVSATLYVQDGALVSAIERGDMREVSCGYTCDIEETPGEHNGERYDRVQRSISYNHVAIVPVGRAGSSVSLHLDAQDNIIPVATDGEKDKKMIKERIDGVDYEVGTEPHKAAVLRRDAAEKAAKDAAIALQARADAAEADKTKLAAQVAELSDPARLDAAVTARAALVEQARKVLGAEAKFDGKSDIEIKAMVAAKVYPSLRLDAKDAVRVETLFEAAMLSVAADVERADAASAATAALRTEIVRPGEKITDIADKSRADMLERNRNEWKQPLAVSVK